MKKQKTPQNYINYFIHDIFGHEQPHPGQEEALLALREGHDTLAIMPAGSGKSLIYQAAGSLIPGPTVVVSPLVALQYDQLNSIQEPQLGAAAVINPSQSAAEATHTVKEFEAGQLEFLFLAPEQFNDRMMLEHLKKNKPSLIVVDEAHSISEWGNDFRPEYLALGAIIEALDHPRVLALTATASLPVRNEIIERLRLRQSKVVVKGFRRSNIWLGVESFQTESDKLQALLEHVQQAQMPGIIYTATRKRAEEVTRALHDKGINAQFYHAGLKVQERTQRQQAFVDNAFDVIVATTAFGMDTNKLDVRFVFHYEISDSVDAYYQEFSHAGRDGKPAKALLLYMSKDFGMRQFLSSSGYINTDQMVAVIDALQAHRSPIDLQELQKELGVSQTKLMHMVTKLEEIGAINLLPDGSIMLTRDATELKPIVEETMSKHQARRRFERSRIEMIREYAECDSCRHAYLLNYFGETFKGSCGYCDVCARHQDQSPDKHPFPLTSRVLHGLWGKGMVLRYEDDKIVVLFDTVGSKSLSLEVIKEKGLLTSLEG